MPIGASHIPQDQESLEPSELKGRRPLHRFAIEERVPGKLVHTRALDDLPTADWMSHRTARNGNRETQSPSGVQSSLGWPSETAAPDNGASCPGGERGSELVESQMLEHLAAHAYVYCGVDPRQLAHVADDVRAPLEAFPTPRAGERGAEEETQKRG
jgi:hypothetical protein